MFRSFLLCGEENEQLRIIGAEMGEMGEMGELKRNERRGRSEGEEFSCVKREREKRTKIKNNNKII